MVFIVSGAHSNEWVRRKLLEMVSTWLPSVEDFVEIHKVHSDLLDKMRRVLFQVVFFEAVVYVILLLHCVFLLLQFLAQHFENNLTHKFAEDIYMVVLEGF